MARKRLITDNETLQRRYGDLTAGDTVVGRLRLRPGEEHLLVDLQARGVRMIPSATSQLCSRSKVFQARILAGLMVPHTTPVYDQHDMMRLVGLYTREVAGPVVCKLDRANGGTGILRFASIEDVYTQAVLGGLSFPFVVQPFVRECRDIRVVVLGGTVEAYERRNPDNFRHNLHCGGRSIAVAPSPAQLRLCRRAMERAGFPYAFVDLLETGAGDCWLSEINLRGGLRGARLSQQDYLRAVEEIHQELLASGRA
ncbi:MAG TPA: hypothetical protein ENK27_00750 [Desulfobulbus sp.]|nr:hypothetical protein [Desulfobulbus sp.]